MPYHTWKHITICRDSGAPRPKSFTNAGTTGDNDDVLNTSMASTGSTVLRNMGQPQENPRSNVYSFVGAPAPVYENQAMMRNGSIHGSHTSVNSQVSITGAGDLGMAAAGEPRDSQWVQTPYGLRPYSVNPNPDPTSHSAPNNFRGSASSIPHSEHSAGMTMEQTEVPPRRPSAGSYVPGQYNTTQGSIHGSRTSLASQHSSPPATAPQDTEV